MLDKKEMDLLEKIELMNNLRLFLNPDKYKDNIKTLSLHYNKEYRR